MQAGERLNFITPIDAIPAPFHTPEMPKNPGRDYVSICELLVNRSKDHVDVLPVTLADGTEATINECILRISEVDGSYLRAVIYWYQLPGHSLNNSTLTLRITEHDSDGARIRGHSYHLRHKELVRYDRHALPEEEDYSHFSMIRLEQLSREMAALRTSDSEADRRIVAEYEKDIKNFQANEQLEVDMGLNGRPVDRDEILLLGALLQSATPGL